jgi:hypothetical protein
MAKPGSAVSRESFAQRHVDGRKDKLDIRRARLRDQVAVHDPIPEIDEAAQAIFGVRVDQPIHGERLHNGSGRAERRFRACFNGP